jgi:hypothetical protein
VSDLTIFVGVGLFYEDGPTLRFVGDDESGVFDLSPFLGKDVRALVFHHPLPHRPSSEPGYGACHWRHGCPFGHGANPHRMLAFDATGIASKDDDGWRIGDRRFPFAFMPGHRCIVAVCPTKWEPASPLSSEGVSFSQEIARLRDVLSKIRMG